MILKDLIFIIKPLSFKEALEYIIKNAQTDKKKTFVVTINPEIIMLAGNDKEYEKILKSADLALADGIGAVFAAKIFGKSLKRRVQGSDLIEKVCEEVSKQPITVGLLGGKENVAKRTAECLTKKYPGLKVAFAIEEWNYGGPLRSRSQFENTRGPAISRQSHVADDARPNSVIGSLFSVFGSWLVSSRFVGLRTDRLKTGKLNSDNRQLKTDNRLPPSVTPRCDILFVAFGPPKQEKWIYKNLPNIDVKVAIGVGGAFDFISGRVPRAPVWIRKVGFEWLFRLIIQPWRWRRQLALPKFVILVLRERFL